MIGLYLRRWLKETPIFEQMKRDASVGSGFILGDVVKDHAWPVLRSIGSTCMLTATILIVVLMSPSLLQKSVTISQENLQIANLATVAALCISTVAIGSLTDRLGVRRVAGPALFVLVVATYALYSGIAHSFAVLLPLYLFAGVGAGAVVLCPILMVGAFPPSVRFSGVSFAYNLAYAVFGGVTPLLVSWLFHLNKLAPAHYVAVAAIVGLGSIAMRPAPSNEALPATGVNES